LTRTTGKRQVDIVIIIVNQTAGCRKAVVGVPKKGKDEGRNPNKPLLFKVKVKIK